MSPKRSAKREPVNVTGNAGGDGPSKVPPTLRAVVTGGVHVAVLLAGPVCCVDMVADRGSMSNVDRQVHIVLVYFTNCINIIVM